MQLAQLRARRLRAPHQPSLVTPVFVYTYLVHLPINLLWKSHVAVHGSLFAVEIPRGGPNSTRRSKFLAAVHGKTADGETYAQIPSMRLYGSSLKKWEP